MGGEDKAKVSITELYKKQISMTEWLEGMGHGMARSFREEDNEKRNRLEAMNRIIGLPFDRQVKMRASDIRDRTPVFMDFLKERGDELCALRLIPDDPGLPKLRMRGHTVKDAVSGWFPKQGIDPGKYRAEFIPHHEEYLWSTIFIVTDRMVFGEIIADTHHNLTQGFYGDKKPMVFRHDSSGWSIEPGNDVALEHAKHIVSLVTVNDRARRDELSGKVGCEFSGNVIKGYFETVTSETDGVWFVDYNKTLGKSYEGFSPVIGSSGIVKGAVGSRGVASGKARVVANPADSEFEDGEVLVCDMTSPDYLPLMMRASAIVTERGGMLCHAAITARELKKPCIVGTGDATKKIMTGDSVTVDANEGVVRKA